MARGWMGAAVVVVATLGCGGIVEEAADVAHPKQFTEGALTFGYPGNWSVTRDTETSPAGDVVSVTAQSPGDALCLVQLYPVGSAPTTDLAMQIMLDTMTSTIEQGSAGTMELAAPVITTETRNVAGATRDVRVAAYSLGMFGVEVPHRMRIYGVGDVLVITNVADEDALLAAPGFDQILDSLVVP